METVYLTLNEELCDGFGTCAQHLPETFELDEWGYAVLKNDGAVPADAEGRARRAIDDCPVLAIKFRGDGGHNAA